MSDISRATDENPDLRNMSKSEGHDSSLLHALTDVVGATTKGIHFVTNHVPHSLHHVENTLEILGEVAVCDSTREAVCGALAGVAKVGTGLAVGAGLMLVPEIEIPVLVTSSAMTSTVVRTGLAGSVGMGLQKMVNTVTAPVADTVRAVCFSTFDTVVGPVSACSPEEERAAMLTAETIEKEKMLRVAAEKREEEKLRKATQSSVHAAHASDVINSTHLKKETPMSDLTSTSTSALSAALVAAGDGSDDRIRLAWMEAMESCPMVGNHDRDDITPGGDYISHYSFEADPACVEKRIQQEMMNIAKKKETAEKLKRETEQRAAVGKMMKEAAAAEKLRRSAEQRAAFAKAMTEAAATERPSEDNDIFFHGRKVTSSEAEKKGIFTSGRGNVVVRGNQMVVRNHEVTTRDSDGDKEEPFFPRRSHEENVVLVNGRCVSAEEAESYGVYVSGEGNRVSSSHHSTGESPMKDCFDSGAEVEGSEDTESLTGKRVTIIGNGEVVVIGERNVVRNDTKSIPRRVHDAIFTPARAAELDQEEPEWVSKALRDADAIQQQKLMEMAEARELQAQRDAAKRKAAKPSTAPGAKASTVRYDIPTAAQVKTDLLSTALKAQAGTSFSRSARVRGTTTDSELQELLYSGSCSMTRFLSPPSTRPLPGLAKSAPSFATTSLVSGEPRFGEGGTQALQSENRSSLYSHTLRVDAGSTDQETTTAVLQALSGRSVSSSLSLARTSFPATARREMEVSIAYRDLVGAARPDAHLALLNQARTTTAYGGFWSTSSLAASSLNLSSAPHQPAQVKHDGAMRIRGNRK